MAGSPVPHNEARYFLVRLIVLIGMTSLCGCCKRSMQLPPWPMILGKKNDIAVLPGVIQRDLMTAEEEKCYSQPTSSLHESNETYCNRTWDDIMCWPDTAAGTLVVQPCANYIHGFNISAFASRQCTVEGTWYFNSYNNKSWSNYSACAVPAWQIPKIPQQSNYSKLIAKHMPNLRSIYNIGYSTSLIVLIFAVIIMSYFKKLHCVRNTVHINLFVSFILRASISCLKEYLLVQGIGLPKDIMIFPDGSLLFKDSGSHWECRTLLAVFNYALMSNYFWVFVEALYLHMLIFVSVFSERSSVLPYMAIGWGGPLLFFIPWTAIRITLENTLCWNTHTTAGYFWVLKGPIVLTIIVNFGFFLNIVRVLFTKLKASNSPEARKFRYRKLARSTLVLIPLFGVHYIVFLALPDNVDHTTELVKLYFEMFFSSFQGFLVALLFCFCNGEVQTELRKKWDRYQLRRTSGSTKPGRSAILTYSSFYSRAGRFDMHSMNSTIEPRTESVIVGNGPANSGASPTCERRYSRWSAPKPGKLIQEETEFDLSKERDDKELDLCKAQDMIPLQPMNQASICPPIQPNNGGGQQEHNTNDQLLQPLLMVNGASVTENDMNDCLRET